MEYNKMVMAVYNVGTPRDSRAGMTSEVIGFGLRFPIGALFYRPKMQRRLGWVEGLQVLGGVFYPSDYKKAAPGLLWPYTIDAGYGPKLNDQLQVIVDQLRLHPETRRAIAFIDNPAILGEQARPCVSSYQFLLSNGKLEMVASVRSWDLVSGFLYDTMVMGMVGLAIANLLRIGAGEVTVTAGTAHVYHKDIEAGRIDPEDKRLGHMSFIHQFQSWEELQHEAIKELQRFRQDPKTFGKPWFMSVHSDTNENK